MNPSKITRKRYSEARQQWWASLTGDARAEYCKRRAEKRRGVPNSGTTSRFVGVSYFPKSPVRKWKAYITSNQTGKQVHLGLYHTEEEAARAYDAAATESRGPGARLNFPGK